MAYPPTSPEGGPSFASEFDILEGIACQVQAMNVAAGGVSYPINASSFFGLLQSIDCNLCRAVEGLGGATCVGGFDGEMGLLMSIACNSRSLVTALSGTNEGNGYEYNTPILWNQINCNFRGGAVATGTAAPGGYSGPSVWNLLESIYCATAQIVDNGFAPPDPIQEFIDAINAFNPDVLLVGDRGTSTLVNGQPVSTWLDQSGNGNNAAQVGTARPTLLTSAQNGKTALSFDGVNDFMLGAFINIGSSLTDIVVYRANAAADSSARITAVGPTGLDEAGTSLGAIVLRFTGNPLLVGPFYALSGQAGSVATTRSAFHTTSTIFSGADAVVTEDGIADAPFGTSTLFGTNQYALASSIAANSFLRGEIAFRAIWASDKTSDLATITAIIKAYYNTP